MFEKLEIYKLWIAFGKGKDLRWIPIHEISNALGPLFLQQLLDTNLPSRLTVECLYNSDHTCKKRSVQRDCTHLRKRLHRVIIVYSYFTYMCLVFGLLY